MSSFLRRLIASAPLLGAPPALAGSLDLGVGLDLASDLPDGVWSTEHASWGLGPGLRVPLRWNLTDSVAARATLRAGFGVGSDLVTWDEYDGAVTYYSDDQWAMFTATELSIGPELILLPGASFRPFLGAEVGLSAVQTWHSFSGDAAAALLDPEQNDLESGSNVDPYTSQLALASGLHGGLRWAVSKRLALEAEVGYNASFLREAALRKTPVEYDAVRSAYGLNVVRAGLAAVIPLGKGTTP